jgi:hypothetical protein
VTAHTIFPVAEARTEDNHEEDCPCGCAPCGEGCRLECLERPRYFCGQLLTDADLTALVEWTRARLGLVRHRDGWGVVCGLDVRCDPRKSSAVEIGEGYAVSCCGSDIVLCKPAVVDLSDACRSPESPCDDPCAPKPEEPTGADRVERSPWDCPEGVWVDVLIDAADEEAGGRSALATDGCRRLGTCEASRVSETHRIERRPSAGDPLARAEKRWTKQYAQCFAALDESGLPEDDTTYGELRLAVERFAFDRACEGGCRALRWICAPGAPSDDAIVNRDVVERVRLAVLLDCLVALGRCGCQTCTPGMAVMLARVLVVPRATEDCDCRVVTVDDAPPYRRPLGHDCPPAGLGRVNLGDLLGQRPEGACLEVLRRHVEVVGIRPLDAAEALALLDPKHPPIFNCNEAVEILAVEDECLGSRVVGFESGRGRPATAAPTHPLMRIEGMTPRRIARLADLGITSYDDLARAEISELRRVYPGKKAEQLEAIKGQARTLADEEGE